MIFWFSGTGNSLWLAQCLQAATSEATHDISKDLLNGNTSYNLKDNERIGFVFPVYGWNMPDIVKRFICHMELKNYRENYTYIACTCGDDMGKTETEVEKLLHSRGWTLHSAFAVQMPNTYVCLPGFNVDSKTVEEAKLALAPQTAKRICDIVLHRRVSNLLTIPGKMAWAKTHILGSFFRKFLMDSRKFHVTDKCIGCGKCSIVCPLANIQLTAGHPAWGTNCAMCLSCYHHCPLHAIEYGSQTKSKGQYINPLII